MRIDYNDLILHPKVGASFESFALEEVIRDFQFEKEECYFWRTHDGAELDLLVYKNGKKMGFEFKFSETVKITKSMHITINDLKLETLMIVTPGKKEYALSESIFVKGLEMF